MRNNGSPPENYCEYQQRQASQDECQCNIVSSTTEDINTEQRSSAIVVRRPRGHAVSINELVAAVQRVANAYQERPPIQPLEVSPQNAYNIPDEIKNFIDGRLVFENGREMVVLGANYTKLRKSDLYGINWNISGTEITKILLYLKFDAYVLGTHTLTGSPLRCLAGQGVMQIYQLDVRIVADLKEFMMATKQMSATEVERAIDEQCIEQHNRLRAVRALRDGRPFQLN